MPTVHPRHSITETPELAAVLDPLRARLGADAPSLGELALRGAQATLRELEARERALAHGRETFVDRLRAGAPDVDLEEIDRIRRTSRRP